MDVTNGKHLRAAWCVIRVTSARNAGMIWSSTQMGLNVCVSTPHQPVLCYTIYSISPSQVILFCMQQLFLVMFVLYSARCSEGWRAYGEFCYQVFGSISFKYDEKGDGNMDWEDAKDECQVKYASKLVSVCLFIVQPAFSFTILSAQSDDVTRLISDNDP